MRLFFALYWGAAYSVAIVCLAGLFLLYAKHRNRSVLRLALFLSATAFAIIALSLREILPDAGKFQRLLTALTFTGAAFTGATFPLFAASLETVTYRERMSGVFLLLGLSIGFINAFLALAESTVPPIALGICTIVFLIAAVYVSLAWIHRAGTAASRPPSGLRAARMLTAVFGLLFALTAFFDFMGGSGLINRNLQGHFILFPAFSIFLFLFVSNTQLRVLMRQTPEAPRTGLPVLSDKKSSFAVYGISPRETEIVVLLAKGHTYQEMADGLLISLATVKSHMTHLFDKTGARNKVELLNILGK